jgi:type I restriction enzyme M protein
MGRQSGEGTRLAAKKKSDATEPLGFEPTLWAAADKLRGNLESAEYKHVVLGLIFLKYVSDAFAERRAELAGLVADEDSEYFMPTDEAREMVLESRDEYSSEGVFWVPAEARWEYLRDRAKQPEIGQLIDTAMDLVERENQTLRGVLPKTYGRADLDKRRLGELVDLLSDEKLTFTREHRDNDVLGRVYEYFLGQFASNEGKGGGEFYTPRQVVQLLVEMIEPYEGRVYDPCCGSGGMFVQSLRFVEAHGGQRNNLSVYGQELAGTTWRLAKMNLAIRGIDADLGDEPADTFHRDKHPDLRADFILANPPFNISDWGGELLRDDPRWAYGAPPKGNANYAWLQHMVHHLAPGGTAGIVLANGSMSSQQSGEGEIRKALVEADLVDCMVALPTQLFYSTGIPVCLWFLSKGRAGSADRRDRRGEVLFIDARELGSMATRVHRVLDDADIARITTTYHAWRGEAEAGAYEDVPGFSAAVAKVDIASHDHVLTPGRYVGAPDAEEDDEPIAEKLDRLRAQLVADFAESDRLQQVILTRLQAVNSDG